MDMDDVIAASRQAELQDAHRTALIRIENAMSSAQTVSGNAMNAADWIGRSIRSVPGGADHMDSMQETMYNLADTARTIEAALAVVHAEVRNGALTAVPTH